MKHLCITDKKRRIRYTSKHYPGRMHDKTIFEKETETKKIKKKVKKLCDLAFYGLENKYDNIIMPYKKPKGKELSERQKARNKKISQKRVRIEHAFAGVKRLRIVSVTTRIKRNHFVDMCFQLSCGLWNFYLWAR